MEIGKVLDKISAQQPKERSAVWMVGEQLKDMVRAEPGIADIIDKDLDVPEMSLSACEKQIKAYADKHRTGNFACVTPIEAENIIRKFYGLAEKTETAEAASQPVGKTIDLADFF
jgi:hypothetical protein